MTAVTSENYYSPAIDTEYMSNSQYKSFCECEAKALAKIIGEWATTPTPAMLVGSYVDAALLGGLDEFKTKNGTSLFLKSGELKAEFRQAEAVVERCRQDALFMKYLSGDTQVIAIGDIAGVPFKAKLDVYHTEQDVIVDLKTCASFAPVWSDTERSKIPFVEAWGYDTQMAIYQWIVNPQARCFIAAVTKETTPDIAVMEIPQERLDYCLSLVGERAVRFHAIKQGNIKPVRCEKCDYCKATKVLEGIVDYRKLF